MNEQKINAMLQYTRQVADYYEAQGKVELGLIILSMGSTLAKRMLLVAGIQNKPFMCAEMRHILKDKYSQEFYIKSGVCLFCDHMRSDVMDNQDEWESDRPATTEEQELERSEV